MHATATRTVAVTPQQVWAVLTDHEGMSSWGPGVTVTMDRQGTSERHGSGAVRRIATSLPGPDLVEEITLFEPPYRMAYRALSGVPLKDYRGHVELTPDGQGTRIRYTVSVEPRVPVVEGLAARAAARALVFVLARQVRRTH